MKKILQLALITVLAACSFTTAEAKLGLGLGLGLGNSSHHSSSGSIVGNGFETDANYVGMAFNGNNPGTAFVDYLPPVESDFTYYASKGIKTLRFSIRWEQAQNTLGGSLNSTYMGYVDNAFTYANAHGIKILLELFDEYQYGGNGVGKAGGPTTAQFADVWGKISARYAGNPALLAYGEMNEPVQGAAGSWQTGAQAAITAIRANDTTAYIFVGGENYSNTYTWVAYNDGLKALIDPSNKLVFEGHFYDDRDSSGAHYDGPTERAAGDSLDGGATLDDNIGVKRLTPFFNWAATNHLKVAIGENGVSSQDNDYFWTSALDKSMRYAKSFSVPFYYFAGRWFDESYPYFLGPSTINPAIDETQMAVLTHLNGTAQPTNYLVTASSYYSAPSVASSPIKVYYRGYLAANDNVTPSDSGAGGTFTPSTVTLTAGYNPSATFTYTPPASAGYFQISMTNSGSLTNPGAFNFWSLSGMASVVEFLNVNDSATIVKDGSNIAQRLLDKSGNGYDGTAGPDGGPLVTTISSKPAFTFDGVNQLLMRNTAAGNAVSAGPRTIIMAVAATSQGNQTLIHNANDSNGESIQWNNDGGIYKATASGGGQGAISNHRTYDTSWHIIVMRVDDTTLGGTRMWIDGVQATTLGQSAYFTNHYQPRIGGNIFFPPHSPMAFGALISISSNITATQINDVVNNILTPVYGGSSWAITDPTTATMVSGADVTDTTAAKMLIPAGWHTMKIEEVGPGAGSGTPNGSFGSGGGASGSFVVINSVSVTAGQTYQFYLPDGDTGYSAVVDGISVPSGNQGNSSFGGSTGGAPTGGDTNTAGNAGTNASGPNGGTGGTAPGTFTNTGGARNSDGTGCGAGGGGMDSAGHPGQGQHACVRFTKLSANDNFFLRMAA